MKERNNNSASSRALLNNVIISDRKLCIGRYEDGDPHYEIEDIDDDEFIRNFPSGIIISYVSQFNDVIQSIELGELTTSDLFRSDDSRMDPSGQLSIDINSEWRIDRHQKISGGSRSGKTLRTNLPSSLVGKSILGISFVGRLKDIELSLGNEMYFSTFNLKGKSGWTICDRRNLPIAWYSVGERKSSS